MPSRNKWGQAVSRSILASLFIVLSFFSFALAKKPILIYYEERTPYAVSNASGAAEGLTATPIAQAFDRADIPFQWKKMPFKRQLMTIKANKKMACGTGWFKKPEREEFARFSDPIYQDRPSIVIGEKENNILLSSSTVKSLLMNKTVKLLVKDSFSYGQYLDGLIDKHEPDKLVVIGSSNVEMLRLILSGRADFFFTTEEEAEEMVKRTGVSISQFGFYHFSDMPVGNLRYLACSQQVPLEVIERINEYLK